VIDWARLEEKSAKKVDIWQESSLSIGGRTILINASLTNFCIYYMSMYLIPEIVLQRIDKVRRRFFLAG
jgi:hypothetical protein